MIINMDQCQNKEMMLKAVAQRKIKLVKLLLDGGVDVNFQGYDGKTPLIVACSFQHQHQDSDSLIMLINLLIKGGANINAHDMKGRTALMYAVRHVLPTDIIQQLLDNGADPNILDDEGRNTYYYIRRNIWPRYKSILRTYLKSHHNTTVSENNHNNHDLQRVNDCCLLYKNNDSPSTSSGTLDNINRRASDPSASCHLNKVKLLPKRKCKSYSTEFRFSCNLIHEENASDITMEEPIEEFRNGKTNKQCTHDLDQFRMNKEDYHSANRKRQFLSTSSCKTKLNNIKSKNGFKSRENNLQHSVSDVDKTIVKNGFKSIPVKLPPIS